ncbi:MAG: SurA N-terminal domain-containing protein [Tannerella sp.]|jgi:peptidyl-prolyl cis-trans isomerase D|nr:SurA N-terminal domain-containing protein [Tannerella sp.]
MATLERIRSRAGLLVTIVGLALLAFIIGDFLRSGSTFWREHKDKVVAVDGQSLKYQEFQKRVDEMSEVYKMQMGQASLSDEYMTQIRQSVYEGFIQETLLNEEMKRLGMEVGSQELFDLVQGENISPVLLQNPMFRNPQTGTFDKAALLNFLKAIDDNNIAAAPTEQASQLLQYKNVWLFWEKRIKLEREQEKYTGLLGKAIAANKLDAQDAYNASSESADIAYTSQAFRNIPDSAVQVSQAEIEKLYNERKVLFPQPESKVITYLAKSIVPSKADYAAAQADIDALKPELAKTNDVKDFVAENSEVGYIDAFFAASNFDPDMKQFATTAAVGDIYGPAFDKADNKYRMFRLVDKTMAPDSVFVSHIMLIDGQNGKEPSEADSLMNVLKKGGDFAQLAARYSVDQNSSKKGGEIGWLTEGVAVNAADVGFKNAIFSAPLNQVVKYNSGQATHLIKVTKRTANIPKYKIADIEKTVNPSSKTYNNLYNAMNQFIAKNKTVQAMDTAAQAAGYILYKNTSVTEDNQNVGSIPGSREVVRWAFDHSKGDQSEIFDCGSKYFVAAFHEGSLRKGYRSLESLEPMLKSELAARLKGQKLAEELKGKNLNSLQAYAKAMSSEVDSVKFITFSTPRITGIGIEPKLNAEIYLAKDGQLSAPIAGNNAVYVFQVTSKTQSKAPFNAVQQAKTMDAASVYRYGYMALQALQNHADITDNRIRFY